ncbi:cytokinesis protein 3 [Physocladia obscura]|uniref:Cytokinesis protein 3 n=1 Tax=Physocladia obscura TaxID=109957 RepID=A0AAD5XHW0_9FUNG|nr:cytokinesis protein 3 [Physocladia obscura]
MSTIAKAPLPDDFKFHCMFSYSWNQKDTVKEIQKYLESKGLQTWRDEDQMYGNTENRMIEGITQSKIILINASKDYETSENCQKELAFLLGEKKIFIVVRLDQGPYPKTRFNTGSETLLYYDLSLATTPELKQKTFDALYKDLQRQLKLTESQIAAKPSIPMSFDEWKKANNKTGTDKDQEKADYKSYVKENVSAEKKKATTAVKNATASAAPKTKPPQQAATKTATAKPASSVESKHGPATVTKTPDIKAKGLLGSSKKPSDKSKPEAKPVNGKSGNIKSVASNPSKKKFGSIAAVKKQVRLIKAQRHSLQKSNKSKRLTAEQKKSQHTELKAALSKTTVLSPNEWYARKRVNPSPETEREYRVYYVSVNRAKAETCGAMLLTYEEWCYKQGYDFEVDYYEEYDDFYSYQDLVFTTKYTSWENQDTFESDEEDHENDEDGDESDFDYDELESELQDDEDADEDEDGDDEDVDGDDEDVDGDDEDVDGDDEDVDGDDEDVDGDDEDVDGDDRDVDGDGQDVDGDGEGVDGVGEDVDGDEELNFEDKEIDVGENDENEDGDKINENDDENDSVNSGDDNDKDANDGDYDGNIGDNNGGDDNNGEDNDVDGNNVDDNGEDDNNVDENGGDENGGDGDDNNTTLPGKIQGEIDPDDNQEDNE